MNLSTLKKLFFELVFITALVGVIFLVLNNTVEHSVVEGSSMSPSLENGQRLIVNKAAFLLSAPQRGQIVILHPPVSPQKQWVKRVIGLPGDTIRVQRGIVYVNNIALDEPYILDAPAYSMTNFIVPPDNYFVMGDNRNHSTDSHYGWTVPRDQLVGTVWLRFWPVDHWGIIHTYPLGKEISATSE